VACPTPRSVRRSASPPAPSRRTSTPCWPSWAYATGCRPRSSRTTWAWSGPANPLRRSGCGGRRRPAGPGRPR
jgi:hypothetical protein